MHALSALVIHPDSRFRTDAGRLTRGAEHAVFFAAGAAEARELLDGRPGLRVVAVSAPAGGAGLAAELRAERPDLTLLVLDEAESRAPARSGLDGRLGEALSRLQLERERRVGELLTRRWRQAAARAAARLAAERLSRFQSPIAAAAGEVRP